MVAAQIWISWFGSSIFDKDVFPCPNLSEVVQMWREITFFFTTGSYFSIEKYIFLEKYFWYSISTISLYMWYIRSTKTSVSSAITLIVICILVISIACSIIVVSASSRHLIAVWFSSTPTSCSLFSLFGKNASWFWYTVFFSEILILGDYFFVLHLWCPWSFIVNFYCLIFIKNNTTVSIIPVYMISIT